MCGVAGVNIEVRAAKTTAELSTWSGNNPLCAAFLLTIDNLSKVINCTQPMAARYMAIADVDGDTLPVCAMDALVVNPVPPPFPPAAAPAPPPTAGVRFRSMAYIFFKVHLPAKSKKRALVALCS